MKIEIYHGNNKYSTVYVNKLSKKQLSELIDALKGVLEVRVKERESDHWRDDDTPEFETTMGTCNTSSCGVGIGHE